MIFISKSKTNKLSNFHKKVYNYKSGALDWRFKLQFQIQVMNSSYDRIRMLESRMRKQSRNPNVSPNEDSLKSIKSLSSKKDARPSKEGKNITSIKYEDNQKQEEQQSAFNILSEDEVKRNRKITDYFTFKPITGSQNKKKSGRKQSGEKSKEHSRQRVNEEFQVQDKQSNPIKRQQSLIQDSKHQLSQHSNMLSNQNNKDSPSNQKTNKTVQEGQNSIYREENTMLKEELKQKDQILAICKQQMLEYVIKCHRLKKNQIRQRVSNNKIRLGQYIVDKKGKQIWIDGLEIREVKEKIQNINKQKQQLEKLKKQSKRNNKQYQQDPQEWKISIAAQNYFLSREQSHYLDTLKRLDQEKLLHIKQLKLLYDEQNSKYGRIDPNIGVTNWVKISKYQLLGLLGKGGFSEVYKAFDIDEMRQVACKIHEFHSNWNSSAKQNYIKHALRENSVHKSLCHPNIVKLYDTVQIDNNSFCTVLQYCQGPDLSIYLKKHRKIPEKQAKMIIKQVINAIRYLHSLPDKVIHYDLKPQNIMFHKGRIKITDFGLCKTTKQDVIELTSQGVGTYWYLPPQCFQTKKKAVITPKVDIWSIGVVYYEMLFGQKPFGDKMSQLRILNEGIMLKATTVNFPVNQKNSVSQESKQFIKQCLRANVEDRIDIWAASKHKLFEKR